MKDNSKGETRLVESKPVDYANDAQNPYLLGSNGVLESAINAIDTKTEGGQKSEDEEDRTPRLFLKKRETRKIR
jgi:hypothetical protein